MKQKSKKQTLKLMGEKNFGNATFINEVRADKKDVYKLIRDVQLGKNSIVRMFIDCENDLNFITEF